MTSDCRPHQVRRQLLEWQQALAADEKHLAPMKRAPRMQVEYHEVRADDL